MGSSNRSQRLKSKMMPMWATMLKQIKKSASKSPINSNVSSIPSIDHLSVINAIKCAGSLKTESLRLTVSADDSKHLQQEYLLAESASTATITETEHITQSFNSSSTANPSPYFSSSCTDQDNTSISCTSFSSASSSAASTRRHRHNHFHTDIAAIAPRRKSLSSACVSKPRTDSFREDYINRSIAITLNINDHRRSTSSSTCSCSCSNAISPEVYRKASNGELQRRSVESVHPRLSVDSHRNSSSNVDLQIGRYVINPNSCSSEESLRRLLFHGISSDISEHTDFLVDEEGTDSTSEADEHFSDQEFDKMMKQLEMEMEAGGNLITEQNSTRGFGDLAETVDKIISEEEEVEGMIAVESQSNEPLVDFAVSIAQMIMSSCCTAEGSGAAQSKYLQDGIIEQLFLHYLRLNDPSHHRTIAVAFLHVLDHLSVHHFFPYNY